MSRLLGHHSFSSACQRLFCLLRGAGVAQICATWFSLDDKYLRSFDRKYRIRTSGFILLSNTSFNPSRLRDATQYGPLNGGALRRFLRQLDIANCRPPSDPGAANSAPGFAAL